MRSFRVYFQNLVLPLGIAVVGGASVSAQQPSDATGPFSTLQELQVDYFDDATAPVIESLDDSIPDEFMKSRALPSQQGFAENTFPVPPSLTDNADHRTVSAVEEMVVQSIDATTLQTPAEPIPQPLVESTPQPMVAPVAHPTMESLPVDTPPIQGAYQADCHTCENPYTCSSDCRKPTWIRSCYQRYRRTLMGDPDLFCERPHGSYLRSVMHSQIAVGTAQRMVLYHYDFYDGNDGDPITTLKPRGLRELARITGLMMSTGFPIVIQASDDNPQLDELRRQQVLATLREAGTEISPNSVVVARPGAPGLNGLEAELLFLGRINQTRLFSGGGRGGAGGGAGGAGGGAGGAGGGGRR